MVTSTRIRLLDILQRQPSATPNELARLLQVTPANVRHHLAILMAEGLVEPAGRRPAPGRGRPEQFFRLGRAARRDNLDRLADALLDERRTEQGGEGRLDRLAGRLVEPPAAAQPLVRRLVALVEQLNHMHYRSRWEARLEGPHLILADCPYSVLLERHPELCALDAAMIRSGLGCPVEQLTRRERGVLGELTCTFLVHPE